ncbi:hypothetical protein NBH19_21015 [Rhizobium sp. S95]|uniref:Cell division and transport-associated protein TolA n=1 Tax=Ciceribacter sichuanensis TaxID=2949647 RepID=A0AAJ1F7Q7_9HYPH|nr:MULTISPECIES: hypothetical protein [unclassified Ciceribacter]MCM2398561.1 hypothetical protein [Ciceribacter sp. S95]MCM2400894.1 hypothetical protein [Ciceribacter sp. S153]MCO5957233.1 hypothetical protein [Ciceribacter sp. S101]
MKVSLATSAVLHALALTWALVSISSTETLDVSNVEALPVELVPIEELTQIQQGDQKAPKAEKAAPVPTKKPTSVENAENFGDNKIDLKSVPTPNAKPNATESSAAPEKVEKVQPKQDNETNDIKEIIKEDTVAEPQKEVAKAEPPKPQVTEPPAPEKPPEPTPQQPDETAEIPLPEKAPVPSTRPKPEAPKPVETKTAEAKPTESQTEKSPDKKKDTKTQETSKSKATKESDFNADEVAALLNKKDPTAGGAKASQEKAALGSKKTIGVALSSSEMDNVRGQIENNWSVVAGLPGIEEVRVQITVELDQSGNIVGTPEVKTTGGSESAQRAIEGSARRALYKSAPLKNLPLEKYDGEKGWNKLVLNFDPSEFAL